MDEFEITSQRKGNYCGGEEVETIREPMVEYGVAKYVLPGQGESGDHIWYAGNPNGIDRCD